MLWEMKDDKESQVCNKKPLPCLGWKKEKRELLLLASCRSTLLDRSCVNVQASKGRITTPTSLSSTSDSLLESVTDQIQLEDRQ